jgi:multidrug efflux pump subunit AcrA (membrane-fusion protein)
MKKRFSSLVHWPWRMLKNHWKLLTFVCVLCLLGGTWIMRQRAKAQPTITFANVTRSSITKALEISGVVDAKEKATLRFIAGGKVTYLGAREGDQVKKWQTLAKIDSRDLEKRLAQDLNLYFNERMDFEQNKDDRQDIARTREIERTMQKDQKTLENSVLDVEIRDIAIRNAILSSPIDGILLTTPTNVTGVQLLATDTFEVVNPNSLVIKAAVDERDIGLVHIGQHVTIRLDAYPDTPLESTVNRVSYRSAQTSTGTVFVVEIVMPITGIEKPLDRYRLGMNGDVAIELAKAENVLTIPAECVKTEGSHTFVNVKTGPETTERRIFRLIPPYDNHR